MRGIFSTLAFQQAQDEFKAATIQEKAAYEVWLKCVGRNKYAMFDEMARERGTWDDLCAWNPKRELLLGGVSASHVRSTMMAAKDWRPTKSGTTRDHHHRTAKGRHKYSRKMFQIDKMYIYKLERGQNHSWSVKLGFGAYLEKRD